MINIKKVISLLIALVLLVSFVFTGCGNTNAGSAESTQKADTVNVSTVQPTTQEELKPVTLKYVLPVTGSLKQADEVFAEANKITESKIKTTVTYEQINFGDYDNKTKLMIASNEEFDICFTSNWCNNYYQNVARGALVDLTDLLDKYASGTKASMSDGVWAATKIKGRIYGIPNQQIFGRKFGTFYRKDLVEKYKFDYLSVKTLQDIEPFLKIVKENEKDVVPIENLNGGIYQTIQNYFGFDWIVGANIPGAVRNFDGSMKVFNQFESTEFRDFLKLMRDWYKKGYIQKDASNGQSLRAQAKYAVVSDAVSKPGGVEEFSSSQTGGVEYVADTNMDGDRPLQTSAIVAALSGISKTSKNPERALMLLEIMNTDKQYFNLIAFGIENKHYTKSSDNEIVQKLDGNYDGVLTFFLGNVFNGFYTSGQKPGIWDETAKLNAESKPSVIIGFAFDSEPVASQIAQCTAVTTEMLNGIASGYLDPDKYLPEFLEKLKKAGADDIVTEAQKQIDEWAKTK